MVSNSRKGEVAGLERLLTVREAASVLGVATSTIYRLCAAGKLPHCRVSNAIRFSETDLAELIHGRAGRQGA